MLDRLSANLAQNLRRLREARGLTQQELSEVSGVPRPTLAHLESGGANPTLGVMARVALALSVPMEELVASPRAVLSLHRAETLTETTEEGVSCRELCVDAPSGFGVERLELALKSRAERPAGRSADRTYLACERGEVDVIAGDEQCTLRAGDVALLERGTAFGFSNRGRGAAVVYSVRLGSPLGPSSSTGARSSP